MQIITPAKRDVGSGDTPNSAGIAKQTSRVTGWERGVWKGSVSSRKYLYKKTSLTAVLARISAWIESRFVFSSSSCAGRSLKQIALKRVTDSRPDEHRHATFLQ